MVKVWALLVLVMSALVLGLSSVKPGEVSDFCTITVNSTGDDTLPDTVVTLREAISFATGVFDPEPGEEDEINGCPAGFEDNPGLLTQDHIRFASAVFPTGSPATISLGSTLPPMNAGNDSINGLGNGVVIDGGGASTCLRVNSSANEVDGLRIINCGVGILVERLMTTPLGGRSPQGPVFLPADENLILFNVLGGNDVGIYLAEGTQDNIVAGNHIGTDSAGNTADPNIIGVLIVGGTNNRVGGVDGFAGGRADPSGVLINRGNLISGNLDDGISIEGGSGNLIYGNRIGTNRSGASVLPNGGDGIEIFGSPGNSIGSPIASGGNLISANGGEGIKIHGDDSVGNAVAGNLIGTNSGGTADLGNENSGIYVIHASNTVIGGTTAGARNVVSGNNGFAGIAICGNPIFCGGEHPDSGGDDASGTHVLGNYIGTNASGDAAIPNSGSGVTVDRGAGLTIGGTAVGSGNVISGNTLDGIFLFAGTHEILIAGNHLGVGTSGIDKIPNSTGIVVSEAHFNQIGLPGAGNVISGNAGVGIAIQFAESANNVIQANLIGVGADGTTPAANDGGGIYAVGSGPNFIGGDGEGEGNVIAYNGVFGVAVDFESPVSISKRISANSIHSNDGLGIDLEVDGVTPNDILDADMGGNALQNYPGLIAAAVNGGTHVEGALNSAANTQYRIEFFANDECDDSGYGEGQAYLGFTDTMTDGTGTAVFTVDLPVAASVGDQITATATDPDDNTSEFSPCIVAGQGEGTPTPTPTPTPPSGSPTPSPSGGAGGILGDADCDLDVDAVDALKVLQDVAGLDPDAPCLAQSDVQCDGDRDAVDALGILIYVAGLPPQPQDEPCPAVGDPIV